MLHRHFNNVLTQPADTALVVALVGGVRLRVHVCAMNSLELHKVAIGTLACSPSCTQDFGDRRSTHLCMSYVESLGFSLEPF